MNIDDLVREWHGLHFVLFTNNTQKSVNGPKFSYSRLPRKMNLDDLVTVDLARDWHGGPLYYSFVFFLQQTSSRNELQS